MAKVLQIRRGNAAANDKFTGLSGEISFDTDNKTLRVHDGVKLGGYALARADGVTSGSDFDINSVPDEFWQAKFAQFAPSGGTGGGTGTSVTEMVSRAVAIRATTYIEYVLATDRAPISVRAELVCQTADCGYAAGDIVWAFGTGTYMSPQVNTFSDEDGLHLRLMIGSQDFWTPHKTTGVKTNVATASWKLQFRVYC